MPMVGLRLTKLGNIEKIQATKLDSTTKKDLEQCHDVRGNSPLLFLPFYLLHNKL